MEEITFMTGQYICYCFASSVHWSSSLINDMVHAEAFLQVKPIGASLEPNTDAYLSKNSL